MKRLLAWITIACLLLSNVGNSFVANAAGANTARDVVVRSNDVSVENPAETPAENPEKAPSENPEETPTEDASENEAQKGETPGEDRGTKAADGTELTLKEQTITTSDGSTYNVQVTYSDKSGIPMTDTELLVSELCKGDAGYDTYIAASAEKLGIEESDIAVSRVFDISIVDAKDHSIVYEPKDEVSVSITLVGTALEDCGNVDVLHFADDTKSADCTIVDTDNTVDGETVTFTTDSFSVYVVVAHEGGTVVTPRVEFHFIADGAIEKTGTSGGNTIYYYEGEPYSFINKHGDAQTTQILKDGEGLELIKDPENEQTKYFYGWYLVELYEGNGASDSKINYTWDSSPKTIAFETPISIEESNVNIGDTVQWSLGEISGSGVVDKNGNVHVYLAPVYEKYNFVNFMLYPHNETSTPDTSNVMTRKLVARGSASQVEVKISDIQAKSTDPVHLIFIGWEYYDTEAGKWVTKQTLSYTGAELCDPGKDGVYLVTNLEDTTSIDLYPVFVEARWVDFYVGESDSQAKYVASRFRESWGTPGNPPEDMEPDEERNIFTTMEKSSRVGYAFGGWYAFAVIDEKTGEIKNLDEPADVVVTYLDPTQNNAVKTVTLRGVTAVKITDDDGNLVFSGDCTISDNGGSGAVGEGSITLFSVENGQMKLYNATDHLKLCANWIPDTSRITVVYWTENTQGQNYSAPENPKDDYSSSAVKGITTAQLSAQLSIPLASGSTLTKEQLAQYTENGVSILSPAFLDDVEALDAGEEKFYDYNEILTDASVTIKGDGSSVINVYFSRKTFKLVFHIGHDGYVKQNGQQRPAYMNQSAYRNWDGNWIQFMFDDPIVTGVLGYTKGPTAQSYPRPAHSTDPWKTCTEEFGEEYTMSYMGQTYSSAYEVTAERVLGNYDPTLNDDNGVYVISAKYGAYIGDRWPTPVNDAFSFTNPTGSKKKMYTWAAYYGSLYCRLANERQTYENQNGNNPDINGVYEYMSAELCSNRAGDDIINDAQVHHLVAYFGDSNKAGIIKNYHIYYEAIDGTYDPETTTIVAGQSFMGYAQTTWSEAQGDVTAVNGHTFFKVADKEVISNVDPKFQLGSDEEGYELVYSCYNTPQTNEHHVYFFYRPKKYPLTFSFGSYTRSDEYYYTEPLADANKYESEVDIPEGHEFRGWYTNAEGLGEPFDFSTEHMPDDYLVLYPITRVKQYNVNINPNGGVIDHNDNSSQSTYFTANYGTTIGEYSIERHYIMLTDADSDQNVTKYYYINMQRKGIESEGDWGLPTELRNAVYVSEDAINAYYNDVYKAAIEGADPDWWTGIQLLTQEEFLATYASYPYREVNVGEHYSFMGWYRVFSDGTIASMPYNFNDPVTEEIELRAMWRLDGGYYVQYDPICYAADGQGNIVRVEATIEQENDPQDPSSELYADQAPTHVLHAPTVPAGWIFRGWRVVKYEGTDDGIPVWTPIQLDSDGQPKYYQPGESFIVDAALATETDNYGGIIHVQAYYEPESGSYRRPDIANLILDANTEYGGYVNTTEGLPELGGPGHSTVVDSTIEIGDIQSNIAVHLYRYATTKSFDQVEGKNFFSNNRPYVLIGFDESSDPENPMTDSAYVPTYSPDSVIAVTRADDITLYAMWEPMIYVTFVNTTSEDLTIDLSGTGTNTVRIVNLVNGEYEREEASAQIQVPAGEQIKIVLPTASIDSSETLTATTVNDHYLKRISVSGTFEGNSHGEGSTDIPYGYPVMYSGTLKLDEEGIFVVYTEEPDEQVDFDVNGGVWTETSTDYEHLEGDLYYIDSLKIVDNNYKPKDPTREGKVFIGWTTNADIAAQEDFSLDHDTVWGDTVITLDGYHTILDKIVNDYLWDFDNEPPYGETLYAVYCNCVTVTFDLLRTGTGTGTKLHVWTGPETSNVDVPHVFYRESETSRYVTYKLLPGETVPKPYDPMPNPDEDNNWKPAERFFLAWLTVDSRINGTNTPTDNVITEKTFEFSSEITESITLYTSWTKTEPQTFTFTVENHVLGSSDEEEFTYHITVSEDKVWGKLYGGSGNEVGDSDVHWGTLSVNLKNNQQYTVYIVTKYKPYDNNKKWDAVSVEMSVIDSEGNVVKSGQITYAGRNGNHMYVGGYKYQLTISQEEKPNYSSNVRVEDNDDNVIQCRAYQDNLLFEFDSKWGSKYETNSDFLNAFTPTEPVNGYDTGEDAIIHKELTIVFTNTINSVVAPTDYHESKAPFLWMLATGLLLCAAVVVYRRRRAMARS